MNVARDLDARVFATSVTCTTLALATDSDVARPPDAAGPFDSCTPLAFPVVPKPTRRKSSASSSSMSRLSTADSATTATTFIKSSSNSNYKLTDAEKARVL